ncbi:YneF family protein [Lactobacillus curvatus]|nr:YneF family protein [Latilactobacillus curvatus]MSE22879.1 YneF family protein [Latilactobacillus curvatus]
MGLGILLFVIGALLGAVAGFLGARAYMKKYFQDNPPINEEMLKAMMMQMGQKPSEKKLNQMMSSMKAQQRRSNKK